MRQLPWGLRADSNDFLPSLSSGGRLPSSGLPTVPPLLNGPSPRHLAEPLPAFPSLPPLSRPPGLSHLFSQLRLHHSSQPTRPKDPAICLLGEWSPLFPTIKPFSPLPTSLATRGCWRPSYPPTLPEPGPGPLPPQEAELTTAPCDPTGVGQAPTHLQEPYQERLPRPRFSTHCLLSTSATAPILLPCP